MSVRRGRLESRENGVHDAALVKRQGVESESCVRLWSGNNWEA